MPSKQYHQPRQVPDLGASAELLAHGLEHLLNDLLAGGTLGDAHCCQVQLLLVVVLERPLDGEERYTYVKGLS